MKTQLCFLSMLLLFLMISGCSKESEKNSKPEEYTIGFETKYWKVYPYVGGPGEDSLYFYQTPVFDDPASSISSVRIKEKSGTVEKARLFDFIGPDDKGYLYQQEASLGQNFKITLWWIQKSLSTVPSADSVFITFKN